jgi:WD40 repeat protein
MGGFKIIENFTSIVVLLVLSASAAAVCPGAHARGDTAPWSTVRTATADDNAEHVFFYAVDGTLLQWSTRPGHLSIIKECLHSVQALAFSSQKKLLIVGDSGGELELISLGASPRTLFSRQFGDGINEVVFSRNSREILIEQRHCLRLWNVAAKKEIWRRDTDDEVVRAVFNADGSEIAVSLASKILILTAATGQQRNVVEMEQIRPLVSDVAFNSSGDKLVAAVNNDVVILDVRSGRKEKTLAGKAGDLIGLTLMNGGKEGIVVGDDNLIQKWDLLTGSVLFSRNLPRGLVTKNGHYLVNTTERPGEIEVWQVSPQKRSHALLYKSPKDRPQGELTYP